MRLFFIIASQFLSGSIWFAANVAYQGQGILLSAVQLGFICGTLVFAALNLSDRFSPAKVFFICSLMGAVFNFSGIFLSDHMPALLITRVICGISLAGIYPVGMKIAASWYPKTVSKALGWLVGALVLAAGFPYLIRALDLQGIGQTILVTTSILCAAGGMIQFFLVKDGPYLPRATHLDLTVIRGVFRHPGFRASAFGYFGHMWELYAVFAYVPSLIAALVDSHAAVLSFAFFVAGFMGCAAGGVIALRTGSRKVALASLMVSGVLCLISPLLFYLPVWAALILIMIWGVAVVADSPQFSTLNALFAPSDYVGSALTIVNCIGFLITIVTIELLDVWIRTLGIKTAFLPLVFGPVFGWLSLKKYRGTE
jgi:MFS family permease